MALASPNRNRYLRTIASLWSEWIQFGVTGATLFSGIGAPEQAAPEIHWRWCSEIDRFCSRVLAFRHPSIPNLGDAANESFTATAEAHGAINILVAGAPCQDFSIAGKRAGMDGTRGNLSLRFVELVGEIRPRWLLFENVPGLISSNEGRDFKCFLEALAKFGYHLAWTVLDAQYFGVAQRRERVFVVGYLGDWRPPFAVLFDIESLSWNPAPGRETREDLAGTLGGGTGERGWCSDTDRMTFIPTTALALNAKGGSGRSDGESETFMASGPRISRVAGFANSAGDTNLGYEEELVPPITRRNGDPGNIVTFDTTQITSKTNRSNPQPGDPSHPLASKGHAPAVAIPILEVHGGSSSRGSGPNGVGIGQDGDPMFTLQSGKQHAVASGPASMVRRLTPFECNLLQGFPSTYTHIPGKRRKVSVETARHLMSHGLNAWIEGAVGYTDTPADGPMYRALGNSMAVPVMRWLLRRIQEVDALTPASSRRRP